MCDVRKTERTVHGPFSARFRSVQSPFESRLTSVLLKRSGVKRTVHGSFFLAHTVGGRKEQSGGEKGRREGKGDRERGKEDERQGRRMERS